VPLSVALGGDDYAFVPPAAPDSNTDRFFILCVLKLEPIFSTEQRSYFIAVRVKTFVLARIYRLHNEPSDDTLCK